MGSFVQEAPQIGSEQFIWDLREFNDKLYGGTRPNGNLVEWNGTDAWVSVAPMLNGQIGILTLSTLNDKLYGGTQEGGRLFEWNGTDAWVQVAGQLNSQASTRTIVHDNKIYGTTRTNGRLFEWNGTNAWVQVAGQLNSQEGIFKGAVFNNELYAGTYPDAYLFKWNGVDAWVRVAPQLGGVDIIDKVIVYKNKIYGGTGTTSGRLYEWNGTNAWVSVASSLNSQVRINDLSEFNDKIYGGTAEGGRLFEWNGTNAWVQVAGKYASESRIYSLLYFDNKIFAGTYPRANLLSLEMAPIVSTDSVTDLGTTTATLNGEVIDEGASTITERGFCYNETGAPNITDDTKVIVPGTTGVYDYDLTGLTSGTTYYVRAYATNSEGTGYGSVVSFTTDEGYSVSTDAVTNLKATTITLNGTVNSSLYATSERGFVYGTSSSPDIYSDTKVTSGSGAGSFDEDITGLLPNTTYYVRAYSKYYDESGVLQVEYGDNVSFTTDTLYGRLKYHNGSEWVLYPRPPQGTENQVTVTDNLDTSYTFSTPQDIHTGATPEFVSALLNGLTASRLVATDGAKTLESVTNLANFISGTTNQITISDDGDGTITISTPQDIHTGAAPTFVSTLLSDLTANRLVSTDGTKTLESIADLTAWIAGTDGNLTVTDDGDGTITLKTIGSVVNVTTLTDTDTLTVPQQGAIKCNKATAMTVNLPTASGNTGLSYFISNVNTGTVTIDPNSAETIQGDATFDLYQDETLNIVSDGTNWIAR